MTRSRARRCRLLPLLAVPVLVYALGTGAAVAAATAPADSVPVVVDRQGDAFDLPLPSTYTPAPGDSYVGIVAGQQESHALVHLDLSSILDVARTQKVVLVVGRDPADTGNELQAGGAALQACIVHGSWSAGRQPSDAVVDCRTAVPEVASGPDAFSFDLTPFLSLWQTAREDGVAIVPVADPTASWRISLRQSRTTAYAVLPPVPSSPNPVVTQPAPAIPVVDKQPPAALSTLGSPEGTAVALAPEPRPSLAGPVPSGSPEAAGVSPPVADQAVTVAAASHGALPALLALGLTGLAALLGFAAPVHLRRRTTHPFTGSPS